MYERPVFKPKYRISIAPGNEVAVFDGEEDRLLVLRGSLYERLVPLVKKGIPTDVIAKKLGKNFSLAHIYYALTCLQNEGLIGEKTGSLSPLLQTRLSDLNLDAELGAQRLQETYVSLRTVGPIRFKSIEERLKKMSIQTRADGGIALVVTDSYHRPELVHLHREFREKKIPWMLAKIGGSSTWIGPLFTHETQGCYECLLKRIEVNSKTETIAKTMSKSPEDFEWSTPVLPTDFAIGSSLIANEVFRWIVQKENKKIEGKVLSFHSANCTLESHAFLPDPSCSCGSPPTNRELVPFDLHSYSLLLNQRSPEEVWNQFRHIVSSITGIVRYFEPLKAKDAQGNNISALPVYHSFYSISDPHQFMKRSFLGRPEGMSGGKGKTEMDAKASCLAEAIERYSGRENPREVRIKGTFEGLQEEAIHPDLCQKFSKRQYAMRETWNKDCHPFQKVPEPFDEKAELSWSPAWSFKDKKYKWVPSGYCYYDIQSPFFTANSNGCAAGSTKEEAILQGFFELVERDSVAIWWYNRLQRPGVDIASFNNSYLDRWVHSCRSKEMEAWALDLTFDLEIPTFAAFAKCKGEKQSILMGFGSHFDPDVALTRAATEVNQSIAWRDTGGTGVDPRFDSWLQGASVQDRAYLFPCPHVCSIKREDFRYSALEYSDQAISACRERIEAKGMELLVLDQTKEEIGLPVVRLIVPGLRHMWRQLGEGRLYEVPYKLGLSARKQTEEEMNPISISF